MNYQTNQLINSNKGASVNRKRTIQKGELRNVEVELVSLLYACDHFAKHGLMGQRRQSQHASGARVDVKRTIYRLK